MDLHFILNHFWKIIIVSNLNCTSGLSIHPRHIVLQIYLNTNLDMTQFHIAM